MNKPLLAGAAAIVVGGFGLWYYLASGGKSVPTSPMSTNTASSASGSITPAPAESAIAHPLPAAPAGTAAGDGAAAPDMEHSDAQLLSALPAAIGAAAVKDYLEPDNMIRRIVVTVDNIPRQKTPVDRRPVRKIGGLFSADGDELHATLDARNFVRYQPFVAVVRNLDVVELMRIYVRFYPLLQHAYQDLGYPNGYFNDRLVAAIDVTLAAPQVTGPIDLVRPHVMYEFADPALEARPAGQKLMIRMGADNAAAIKVKLTELRAALTAAAAH